MHYCSSQLAWQLVRFQVKFQVIINDVYQRGKKLPWSTSGAHKFYKILGATTATWSMFLAKNPQILDLIIQNFITTASWSLKAPITRSNKSAQQRVVQQETVPIHNMVSWRKLRSLGKCHNETCPKLPVRQLFLLMWWRKRPYTGRGKGVFGQRIG